MTNTKALKTTVALGIAAAAITTALLVPSDHSAPTITPAPGSAAAIHVPAAAIRAIYPDMTIPPCQHEDSHNCYWDAATRGDHKGTSFIDLDGKLYR